MSKDYTIKPCGDQYCLYSQDGTKVLGRHATQEAAQAQEELIVKAKSGGSTYSLPDVEIFSTGEHNGDKYDIKDLQDMVAAHQELDFLPALKAGHARDSGAPALGYVSNLRLNGEKVIGDFQDMPAEVYSAVLDKRYGRVSAEVYWNMKRAGKKYRRALGAVALLGQEIPGVASLKPLYQTFELEGEKMAAYEADLEYAQSAAAQTSQGSKQRESLAKKGHAMPDGSFPIVTEQDLKNAIKAHGRASNPDAVKSFIKKRAAAMGLTSLLPAEWSKKSMADVVSQMGDLVNQVNELYEYAKGELSDTTDGTDQRSGQQKEVNDMSEATAKELQAKLDELSGKVSDGDAKLKAYAAENERLRQFQRETQVKEKVSACKLPAIAPMLTALYSAVLDSDTKVKLYSEDGKTHEDVTATDALDKLVAHINGKVGHLFKMTSVNTEKQEGYEDAGAELDKRAKEAVKKKEYATYEEAIDGILSADPELKEAYVAQRHAA